MSHFSVAIDRQGTQNALATWHTLKHSLFKVRRLCIDSDYLFLALARWCRRPTVADEDDNGHDQSEGEGDEPDDIEDGDIGGAEGAIHI